MVSKKLDLLLELCLAILATNTSTAQTAAILLKLFPELRTSDILDENGRLRILEPSFIEIINDVL